MVCGDWCGVTGTGGAEWEQRMSSLSLDLGLALGGLVWAAGWSSPV